MGNKRIILMVVISIEVVIIAACAIFLVYAGSDPAKVRRQSEMAQRCLLEEEYEQAIAVFQTIIEIDPRNAEAYLGLAEAYRETDDWERMIQTLEIGFEKTDSVDIQKLLDQYADKDIKADGDVLVDMVSKTDMGIKQDSGSLVETGEKGVAKIREGFMVQYNQITEIPEGYTGLYTLEDIKNMGNDMSGKYILMNDIDVQGDRLNLGNFAGVLQGNYHVLSNQTGSLFSEISGGSISDLALMNVDAEYAALARTMYRGYINNCFATGRIAGEGEAAGGLVGEIHLSFSDLSGNCNISSCYNTAEITGSREAGGIVGKVEISNGMDTGVDIMYCENYGQVSGGIGSVGGIIGTFDYIGRYDKSAYKGARKYMSYRILQCINYASVVAGESGYAGGIAGEISVGAWWDGQDVSFDIIESANYGDVVSSQYRRDGGICGRAAVSSNEYYNHCAKISIRDCLNVGGGAGENSSLDGGICGVMETDSGTISIERCLNIGGSSLAVTGRTTVVNYHEGLVTIEDCYCTDGETIWDGVMKLTKQEIKNPEHLNNFNFSSVWKIDEERGGYPRPLNFEEEMQLEMENMENVESEN